MTDPREKNFPLPAPLLGSVALEPNRWKKDSERVPSLLLSQLAGEAQKAGFAGWEIWERHYLLADEAEQSALRESFFPVIGWNSYYCPGYTPAEEAESIQKAIHELGSRLNFIKFNLGPKGTPFIEQVEAALTWADKLPNHVRLYCECHGGTILEDPDGAARAFSLWPEEKFSAIIHPLTPDVDTLKKWFETLGGRIVHLHLQGRDQNRKVAAASTLADAYQQAWEVLRKNHFSGTASIEFVAGLNQPGESPASLFAQACADVTWLRENQFVC